MRKVKGKTYCKGETIEFEEAKFHQWGSECCEDGEYTVAIVELVDGRVGASNPDWITFLE